MNKAKVARALGIVGALLVPAVVVAQQFQAGETLRAVDLQALVASVDQLSARVLTLETALQSVSRTGPGAQRFGIITADATITFTANGDGFVVAVPGNTGFNAVNLQAFVDNDTETRHFRATEGNTLNMIVSQAENLVLTVAGIGPDADVNLYWFPLHRDAPAPACVQPGVCT